MKRAIYPGSFDPLTFGHIDIIKRSVRLFDTVVVALLTNPQKTPLFSVEERVEIMQQILKPRFPTVEIEVFHGLLVDYATHKNANAIVRGIRAVTDFEYEFQMALMNRKLEARVETIFLMPKEEYTYLSSRIVKEIARLGGNVGEFLPARVAAALQAKLKK